MKQLNLLQESNKMPIIRIAPVCNGKIYVTPRMTEEGNLRLDLPIVESVEHVSTQSDKPARRVKEKFHQHLHTDASPRFCVQHRSALPDEGIVYLYVLPLRSEEDISFLEGKLVTSEDIAAHPEEYGYNLQMESELLGMAAELWADFFETPPANSYL